jgi:hypothetical protein
LHDSQRRETVKHDHESQGTRNQIITGAGEVKQQFNIQTEFSQLWDIRQPVMTLTEEIVRIYYQETTSEDVEDFMCATGTVIFRVCKPVRLLQLLVITDL